jgi:hypothetical protein
MPHFGLMDENKMDPRDAELLRARLHLRAARRRLRQGKVSTGLATLFDSLLSALRFYALSQEHDGAAVAGVSGELMDEQSVYDALVKSGTLDSGLDFGSFRGLTEDAIGNKLLNYDYTAALRDVESILTRLGVSPFDEDALPPEKPGAP